MSKIKGSLKGYLRGQGMKDWECMTGLLLEEPGRGEERE